MRVSVHLVWPKSPFQSGCQFDIMVKEWRKLNSSINCSADGGKEAGDKNRHVLVFRRFEVEDGVKFPRNITQLAQLYENNKAVEFHSRFFFEGHHIPGLDKWFNYSLRERAQVKTWELRYNRSTWEPQLIMRDDAPYHFEQIPTRVQDHQVLANELCRASHKFYLLSHVFNAHRGIKQSFTPVEKVVSEAGKVNARAIIPTFNAYLDSKYPDTKGKCPTINV
ncbi:glycosyl-transferase for dystroglycan domain-containing protein [Ditylenchus destructor]|nr:glycosyl-transferase for dystroglycan domain-containing protein [Ditylenchus destructor]